MLRKLRPKLPYYITRWVIILIIFISELFIYAWCRVQCIHIGYDIRKQIKEYEQLIGIQNSLKIELASLKSPERISNVASQKLGLVMPGPNQIIIIP